MALKGRLRGRRSKRLSNVSQDFETNFNGTDFSSTDTDVDETSKSSKVREDHSICNIMKKGESFQVDGDHIYTYGKSSKNLESPVVGKKRKRNLLQELDQKLPKKSCFSKNALMAKLNRERKKVYISNLETQNEKLQTENNEIKNKIQIQDKIISSMKYEISYLKGLLANSEQIGKILHNLKSTTGLPVTSSLKVGPFEKIENCKEDYDNFEKDSCDNVDFSKENSANCGFTCPLIQKDINFSSSSDMSVLNSNLTDFESFFDFDKSEIETAGAFSDADLLSCYECNLNNHNSDKFLKGEDEINAIPSAGICLHVNKERISVEFCSICNSKVELCSSVT